MNDRPPDLSWRQAWRASMPWQLLALALTLASAAAVNYLTGNVSGASILLFSGLTSALTFPLVALGACLSRPSVKLLVLVVGPWLALSSVIGGLGLAFWMMFSTRLGP
jgi:hypothetical protein